MTSKANQLWVSLNEQAEGSIFAVYPRILSEMFLSEEQVTLEDLQAEADQLILPSDKEWRYNIYFKLVEEQRAVNDGRRLFGSDKKEDPEPPKECKDSCQSNLDKSGCNIAETSGGTLKSTRKTEISPSIKVTDTASIVQEISQRLSRSRSSSRESGGNTGSGVFGGKSWDEVRREQRFRAVSEVIKSPPLSADVGSTAGCEVEWSVKEVAKAGYLLLKPPMDVDFEDEHEMRRVYSLVYDVFRYKNVLDDALHEVDFFAEYPRDVNRRQLVWLILLDLARRRWVARPRPDQLRAIRLFMPSNLDEVDSDVWAYRVRLGAAVAKIRIRNRAVSLSDLLPQHLREDRLSTLVTKDVVSGWINVFKIKRISDLIDRLSSMGYTYSTTRNLRPQQYRFDQLCPQFILIRPPQTENKSLQLVADGTIVLQEREFCAGAATFCRSLRECALRGDVAQTHATSARSTAYLAAQLAAIGGRAAAAAAAAAQHFARNEAFVGRLIVFGAGEQSMQYYKTLISLGVHATLYPVSAASSASTPSTGVGVLVCSLPVYSAPVELVEMLVAAMATPPNSYSAVTDPIDLVCGRGGDLDMLKCLTESEVSADGKCRVASILEEQKKTLKFLMSKPQIQMILYETHSSLSAENGDMVKRAISESNRAAREHHVMLRKGPLAAYRLRVPATPTIIVTSEEMMMDTIEIKENKPGTGDVTQPPSAVDEIPEVETQEADSEIAELQQHDKRPQTVSQSHEDVNTPASEPRDPDLDSPNVKVPKSDLFEIRKLSNLKSGADINLILDQLGCYLCRIERKELTRMDAKYMINIAEERGLFGRGGASDSGGAMLATSAKKETKVVQKRQQSKRRMSKAELERIAAPTHSSILRNSSFLARRSERESASGGTSNAGLDDSDNSPRCALDPGMEWCCERHARHEFSLAVACGPHRARLWWRLAAAAARRRAADSPRRAFALPPLVLTRTPKSVLAMSRRLPLTVAVQKVELQAISIN